MTLIWESLKEWALLDFIIVLGVNLWLLIQFGIGAFKKAYNGGYSTRYSIGAWLYAAWGIFNLILWFS